MATIIDDTRNIKAALTISSSDGKTSEIEAIGGAWDSAMGSFSSLGDAFSSGVDLSPVGQAAVIVVEDAFKEVYRKMQETRRVKIKTLMGMTGGAFARSPVELAKDALPALHDVLSEFIVGLGSDLISDPRMIDSVKSIKQIQALSETVQSILTLYNTVKSLGDKLEPIFPVIEIVVSAASIWATGGASAAAFSSQSAQLAMQELKKLVPILMYPIKEEILNKEIEVPIMLLGGLERLQSAQAQQRWAEIMNDTEKALLLDHAHYTEVTSDLKWSSKYRGAVQVIEQKVISPYVNRFVSELSVGRSLQYRNSIDVEFWQRVETFLGGSNSQDDGSYVGFVDGSYTSRVLGFDEEEISSLSKEIIDAKDTSLSFYMDRQMHKLILSELKLDGAVIDIEKKLYDEHGTKTNPKGDRASFKEINDRITLFHSVLRSLTGETRADITEDIPVVDFYRKRQTGLKNKYIDSNYIEISPISSFQPLDPRAPSTEDLMDEQATNFINFGLSQYDPQIHFYNTKSRMPRIPNIQVDYAVDEEGYSMKASGLLNGLFTSPKRWAPNGEDIEAWGWNTGEGSSISLEEWTRNIEELIADASEDVKTKKLAYEEEPSNAAKRLDYIEAKSEHTGLVAQLQAGPPNESENDITYQALALSYGVEIPRGVKYNPAHLTSGPGAGDRHVVPAPLAMVDSLGNPIPNPRGYGGKAEFYYDNLINAVQYQLIEGHEVNYDIWRSLGGVVEDITSSLNTGTIKEGQKTVTDTSGILWWKKTSTRIVNTRTYISGGHWGKKLDFFVGDENRLDPSIWNSKFNLGTKTLTLNCAGDSDKDISITSHYVTRTRNRGWFRWIWKTKAVAKETAWTDHPSRVFKAHIRASTEGYNGNYIEKIECIMPQEVIRKKSSWGLLSLIKNKSGYANYSLGKFNGHQARLLIPQGEGNSQEFNMPRKFYLMSTSDLGFRTELVGGNPNPRSLCTFYSNTRMLVMEVSSIDRVVSPKEMDNFTVIYEGVTVTYNKAVEERNAARHRPSMPKPILEVEGESCYVYTLKPLAIDFLGEDSTGDQFDMFPIKYPREFFEFKQEKENTSSHTLKRGTSVEELRELTALMNFKLDTESMMGMDIAVGIPLLENSSDFYKKCTKNNSVYNFRMMDFLMGREKNSQMNIKPILKQLIKNIPAIKIDPLEGMEGEPSFEVKSITLEQIPDVIDPLVAARYNLELIANMAPGLDISGLIKRINEESFREVSEGLKDILVKFDDAQGADLLNLCKQLDFHLADPNKPWLSVGEDPSDHVSGIALRELAHWIKNSLEGRGGVPVRFLAGQSQPEGDPSSLYYQRYLFLNNRMHWTSGHLAQAAQRMLNWEEAVQASSGGNNKLEAYLDHIDAVSIAEIAPLTYSPDEYGADGSILEEGKFFNERILEHVREKIDGKCLLMCVPCPVAESCPFFKLDKTIKAYIPATDSIEIWLKDNKLNLLVFDQNEEGEDYLPLYSDGGSSEMDIEEFKNRQKVYVEIVKDKDTDFPLKDVRDKINNMIPGFNKGNGSWADDLGWLQGGRYGSLRLDLDGDVDKHKYLFDAIFVRDEETEFIYKPSSTRYPVEVKYKDSLDRKDPTVYKGDVRILIPQSLSIFEGIGPSSEVYLVSDDWKDPKGEPLEPLIYINTVGNIQYAFDLREDGSPDGATESDTLDRDSQDPLPADVAQWHANTFKWLSEGEDQWWMPSVRKKTNSEGAEVSITLEGRKRVADVIDPLVSTAPPMDEVLNGKPFVNSYVNFVRKMRIKLDCFAWVKGDNVNVADIDIKKQTLVNMKTNVRLVVIKK